MVINHNMASMNANRMLNNVSLQAGKASEKLVSGYRINRSADDAAGLAISVKMRRQIRGLTMASQNVSDAISLVQTAEGALHESQNMLQRMNQLAVQAANDTNSAFDRKSLQLEVSQLITEVDKIADTTSFNEMLLLDGRFAKAPEAGTASPLVTDSKVVVFNSVAPDQIEVAGPYWAEPPGMDKLKEVLDQQIVPQAIDALINTYSQTFGYLRTAKTGIGLQIYEDNSSTTLAAVSCSSRVLFDPTQVEIGLTLRINTSTLVFDGDGNLTDESRKDLETTIVHEMMHGLMFETFTAGMIQRRADYTTYGFARFPTWFIEGTAQAGSGHIGYLTNRGLTPSAMQTMSLENLSAILKNPYMDLEKNQTPSHYGTGYLAVMYLGYLASGNQGNYSSANIGAGIDTFLNELKKGYSMDTLIKYYSGGAFAGTDDFESKFGTYDPANPNAETGVHFVKDFIAQLPSSGKHGLVGGYAATDVLKDEDLETTVLDLKPNAIDVKNVYSDDYVVYSGGGQSENGWSPDTRNNSTKPPEGSTPGGGTVTPPVNPDPGPGGGTGTGTGGGKVMPQGGIIIQSGAENGDTTFLYIEGMNASALGIKEIDISTKDGASRAIDVVKGAINKISKQRAELGAMQNRLEHQLNSLANTVENLTAAESNIRDADMASEITKLQKHRIILQAGYAILAQANALPQNVLSLLEA